MPRRFEDLGASAQSQRRGIGSSTVLLFVGFGEVGKAAFGQRPECARRDLHRDPLLLLGVPDAFLLEVRELPVLGLIIRVRYAIA